MRSTCRNTFTTRHIGIRSPHKTGGSHAGTLWAGAKVRADGTCSMKWHLQKRHTVAVGEKAPPVLSAVQRDAILMANEILTASELGDSATMVKTFLAAIDDESWPSVVSGMCSISKGLAAQLELLTGKSAEQWRVDIVHGVVLHSSDDSHAGTTGSS